VVDETKVYFAGNRGRYVDLTILGALEVAANGGLAS
jgi:acyl CoA:acetate/3-ketoacid CoA transferase beta subunit